MVGGMAMKEDENRGTPQQLSRAEYTVDRIASLQSAILNLECAEEILAEEGFLPTGTIPEMVEQVRLIIRDIENEFLEGG